MPGTKMRPTPYERGAPSAEDEDDEDAYGEHIDPHTAEVNRFFNLPKMREFSIPTQNDHDFENHPNILGPPDWEEEARMQQPDPNKMLAQLRGETDFRHPNPNAPDPSKNYRAQAVEELLNRQGVQRPGMKTEDDYRQQFHGENPDFTPAQPRMSGLPEINVPAPGEEEEHAAAAQMSDEELLAKMQEQMEGRPSTDTMSDDVNNPDNWPDTPEEFMQKFGREPTTDSEVEFYYGPPGDDREMEMDPPTDERDMRSGRG